MSIVRSIVQPITRPVVSPVTEPVASGAAAPSKVGTFDGSNDRVSFSATPSLSTAAMSVSAIFTKNDSSNDGLLNNALGSNRYVRMTGSNVTCQFGSGNVAFGFSAYDDGDEHQLILVRQLDGTTRVYIDGTESSAGAQSTGVSTFGLQWQDIGVYGSGSNLGYWSGVIRDVRVFDKPLSDTERAFIDSGFGSDPGTPDIGWWKFDEGTGTTIADASGNGNDGTLTGATSEEFWLEPA